MRVFLDTNVIVSGFTARGLCADLVRDVLTRHTWITSDQILAETEDVLLNRFKVPPEDVAEILALLRRQEIAPLPDPLPAMDIRDPDDLAVVAAALHSNSDFLVTGDKDITSLTFSADLRIVTPREYFQNAIHQSTGG